MLGRRVDVHHECDVVDVDPSSSDVGGDEHERAPGHEVVKVALASVLRQVAVQLDRRDPAGCELLGQLLGTVLGAGEQQRTIHAGREVANDRGFVGGTDGEHVVRHRGHLGRGRIDRVHDRVHEVTAHDRVDPAIERRREQEALTLLRRRVEQPADRG